MQLERIKDIKLYLLILICCLTGAERADSGLPSSECRPGFPDGQRDSNCPQLQGRGKRNQEISGGSGADARSQETFRNLQFSLSSSAEGKATVMLQAREHVSFSALTAHVLIFKHQEETVPWFLKAF